MQWPNNLGSERDWKFVTRANPYLNGRSLLWSMGKVLGGGSSVNAMIWARGHKADWDCFAAETGEPGWSYHEILKIYRRIEDWQGEPDPERRGVGGLLYVQPAPEPNPIAPALVEAANSCGIPAFADHNGSMMEGAGGAALCNLRVKDGKRLSVFRSYVYPYLDRPNLTLLSGALVARVEFNGQDAASVRVIVSGEERRICASREIVLSLSSLNTPKALMLSGIGDEQELQRFDITTKEHLPGVGSNLQDHLLLAGCLWEYKEPLPPRNNGGEATLFWKSEASLPSPDLQILQAEFPLLSPDLKEYQPPAASWYLGPSVQRPKSRGRVHLTGPNPSDPLDIDANLLSDPDDLRATLTVLELTREIGNSAPLRPYAKREVVPGNLCSSERERFVRNAVIPLWHQTCTAKMGRDGMAVVDGQLRVRGVSRLRVADGSVLPRLTTGNTMAPCVIIGERAAELIRRDHGL